MAIPVATGISTHLFAAGTPEKKEPKPVIVSVDRENSHFCTSMPY